MKVLLANDDGITAPGLRALYAALTRRGHEVAAIAPMRQQSGVSHAITVFEPLRTQIFEEDDFRGTGVFGTPADCVKLGLSELAPWKPDLVLSGINLGKNVGPDVFYSGTIGAAAEGAHAGIAAMAVSHAQFEPSGPALAEAAQNTVLMIEKTSWQDIKPGIVLNLNYPHCALAESPGLAICRQAPAVWLNGYEKKLDPRNMPYWWMTGELDWDNVPPDSDVALLARGFVTLTPLKFEHTADKCLEPLARMNLGIACFNV